MDKIICDWSKYIYIFAIILGINLKCNVIIHFLVLTLQWQVPFTQSTCLGFESEISLLKRDKVVYQLYLPKPIEVGALCTRYDFLFSIAHLSLFSNSSCLCLHRIYECVQNYFLYLFEMPYYCQFSVVHYHQPWDIEYDLHGN